MKRKVCKTCKMFIEGGECPVCKTTSFSITWKGRIQVLDPQHSAIAKRVGMDKEGEYAIKVQ
jgi:RNA polymerase subunit RPABC4/transcription elongation factor Spt4